MRRDPSRVFTIPGLPGVHPGGPGRFADFAASGAEPGRIAALGGKFEEPAKAGAGVPHDGTIFNQGPPRILSRPLNGGLANPCDGRRVPHTQVGRHPPPFLVHE